MFQEHESEGEGASASTAKKSRKLGTNFYTWGLLDSIPTSQIKFAKKQHQDKI